MTSTPQNIIDTKTKEEITNLIDEALQTAGYLLSQLDDWMENEDIDLDELSGLLEENQDNITGLSETLKEAGLRNLIDDNNMDYPDFE